MSMSLVDIECRFEFICPKTWDELELTERENIRFCNHCEESVYFVGSDMDAFDEHAKSGRCIAVLVEDTQPASEPEGGGPRPIQLTGTPPR
ncbi:hypothetical protein ACWJJH_12675 [Endozoicomonadaceae bacterium StTr2]